MFMVPPHGSALTFLAMGQLRKTTEFISEPRVTIGKFCYTSDKETMQVMVSLYMRSETAKEDVVPFAFPKLCLW